MITLTVLTGPDAGQVLTFDGDVVVIGRSSMCDFMLHDASLGRRHCEIRRENNRIVLADLGSVNGTFVNDREERITTQLLHSHDQIRLGKTRLRIEFAEPEQPIIPPPSPVEAKPLPSSSRPQESPPHPPTLPAKEQPVLKTPPPSSPPPHEAKDEATVIGSPPLPPPPRLRLRVIEGTDAGATFEPKASATHFTVGRGQTADFVLKDHRVSRIHFTIEQTPAGFLLVDNGSLNGTFLNNAAERVERATLHHGDIIAVSDTRLQVEIPSQGERTTFAPLPPRPLPSGPRQSRTEPRVPPPLREAPLPPRGPVTIFLPSRWQAVFVALFLVTVSSWGLFTFRPPSFFASGPLTTSHSPWEGECATCHTPWESRSINTTCAAVECHAQVLHVNTQRQDNCVSCHSEHRGSAFNMKGGASECWQCHQATFVNRSLWRHYNRVFIATGAGNNRTVNLELPASEGARRQWQQSAPHDESGLIFAHAAHAKSSGQSTCLSCHQPLPGTVINALGAGSAFPSHEECIECHKEVGDRDPQLAVTKVTAQCSKCHTREDNRVVRLPRTPLYVRFSHDNHKAADCIQCHFLIPGEHTYRPALRSTFYPFPMEGCVSCHEKQQAPTTCLGCHPAHHATLPVTRTENGLLAQITLQQALFAVLALEFLLCLSVYWGGRE